MDIKALEDIPETDGLFDRRKKILNEIYKTEKSYQHHLVLLKTLFLEPIKISSVLPNYVIDGIFSNIEAIQRVSLHLMELMEAEGVIHALLHLAPYLKLYSLYANNFNKSSKLLEDCLQKYPDFTRLVNFQENREEMQSLKLSALLVTPIQRIPRYRLLVGTLLEKTPSDAIDYAKLNDAHEKLDEVANHINECVRQHENFTKMLSVQNRFVGENKPQIITPGRVFIKEGKLDKVTLKGQSKERTVYLFNDILIVAKNESNGMLSCKEIFTLRKCIVENVLGNKNSGQGLFRLISNSKNSILLCSKDESSSWMCDIKTAIRCLHSDPEYLQSSLQTEIVTPEKPKMKFLRTFKGSTTETRCLLKRQTVYRSQENEGCLSAPSLTSVQTLPNQNPHFYHRNDSLNTTISASMNYTKNRSISPGRNEVFEGSMGTSRKQNWSLSTSSEIESRRPLRSLRNSARHIGSMMNCSEKRKQVSDSSLRPFKRLKSSSSMGIVKNLNKTNQENSNHCCIA